MLLRDFLAASPAKAMISYDDRPEVRKLYADRILTAPSDAAKGDDRMGG